MIRDSETTQWQESYLYETDVAHIPRRQKINPTQNPTTQSLNSIHQTMNPDSNRRSYQTTRIVHRRRNTITVQREAMNQEREEGENETSKTGERRKQ